MLSKLRRLDFRKLLRASPAEKVPHVRWLDLRNHGGSVEHYYHFLLGYLLPLCAYLEQREEAEPSILLARGCGPLSHLVRELQIPGLLLCEPQSLSAFSREADDLGLRKIEILGLDRDTRARLYEVDRLVSVAGLATRYIQRRLGCRIDSLCEDLKAGWKPSPRLMVVKREPPDPYYRSELAEVKGGGTERRSIANMAEMIAALSSRYEQTKVVSLEGRGLAEQIAFFRTADIVVAQHGAALANIIWMRPKTHVFEFLSHRPDHVYFKNLSPIFGVEHHILAQENNMAAVDVNALLDAIESIL